MKDEIVEITKFRRTEVCWVCTDCDSENPTAEGVCLVCGKSRTENARLVGPGIRPKPVVPPSPPPKTPPTSGYSPTPPASKGFNAMPLIIIFLILLIVGIAYFAAQDYNMSESPDEIMEITEYTETEDDSVYDMSYINIEE